MRILKNILIMIGMAIAVRMVGNLLDSGNPLHPGSSGTGSTLFSLMVLVTAVWASICSNILEFRKYKSGMSYHPVTVLLVNLLFWAVAFPWFLTVRDNVKDGTATLKDEFRDNSLNGQGKVLLGQNQDPPTPPVLPSIDKTNSIQDRPPSRPINQMPLMPATPPRSIEQIPPISLPQTRVGSEKIVSPPPLPPPLPSRSMKVDAGRLDLIQKMAELKNQGVLTEEEFQEQKRKVLG